MANAGLAAPRRHLRQGWPTAASELHAMTMRDDFSTATANVLARRAGFRCSNPGCQRPTSGAQLGGAGAVSIGQAAHITAAAPGGPRYDASLTPAERSRQENGIWLCAACATLIDRDPSRYTADLLRTWRGY